MTSATQMHALNLHVVKIDIEIKVHDSRGPQRQNHLSKHPLNLVNETTADFPSRH